MDLGLLNFKTHIYHLISLKFQNTYLPPNIIKIEFSFAAPIHLKNSGEKFLKYQYELNPFYVIMSWILLTPLLHNALIEQGEIGCWSHLGLARYRSLML